MDLVSPGGAAFVPADSPSEAATFQVDGADNAPLTVVLAHGAGAPMDSPFMTFFAEGVAIRGYRAIRFEFPYMAARRRGRTPKPPDRVPILLACWRQVITQVLESTTIDRVVIGGKSLGGRMASMVADETGVAGLVCLGYPFHPPGMLTKTRVEHLQALKTPTVILQGTRDPFGHPEEVAGYGLSPAISLAWLADGDHSFTPRRSSGRTETQAWAEALDILDDFLQHLIKHRAGPAA